jgi:hypothetical protein
VRTIIALTVVAMSAAPALAWDGYDYNKGTSVEIGKGNLVRSGREIEFFDYQSGEYRTLEVDSIYRSGGSVVVEGTDTETGETRELEMDGN